MSATTALRQSRYQTVAQTATRPNTSIISPSALLPEKESWTCSERGTRIGSKHPPSVVHTEGIFIPVTNYTSVPLSLRRLLLNLFRHVDQTKAVEHPINIRHTPDIPYSYRIIKHQAATLLLCALATITCVACRPPRRGVQSFER